MASMLCSQGVVLATAMAVSGTVLLLAFRLQKSLPTVQFLDQIPQSSQEVLRSPQPSQEVLRSCISSEGGKKKKRKKVHFAKDVVDPRGNGEEFRRQLKSGGGRFGRNSPALKKIGGGGGKDGGMPANRVVLYNAILRDRVVQRLAYSC